MVQFVLKHAAFFNQLSEDCPRLFYLPGYRAAESAYQLLQSNYWEITTYDGRLPLLPHTHMCHVNNNISSFSPQRDIICINCMQDCRPTRASV